MHILVCTSLRILGTTLRRNFSSGLTLGVWEVIKNVLEKVSVFNCPSYIDSKCYGSQPAVFICHSSSASLLHLTLWFFFSFHDAVNDIIIIIIYLNFFFYWANVYWWRITRSRPRYLDLVVFFSTFSGTPTPGEGVQLPDHHGNREEAGWGEHLVTRYIKDKRRVWWWWWWCR